MERWLCCCMTPQAHRTFASTSFSRRMATVSQLDWGMLSIMTQSVKYSPVFLLSEASQVKNLTSLAA